MRFLKVFGVVTFVCAVLLGAIVAAIKGYIALEKWLNIPPYYQGSIACFLCFCLIITGIVFIAQEPNSK